MKKTDPRYEAYKVYQRDYRRKRRQRDYEFRVKANWSCTVATHKRREAAK